MTRAFSSLLPLDRWSSVCLSVCLLGSIAFYAMTVKYDTTPQEKRADDELMVIVNRLDSVQKRQLETESKHQTQVNDLIRKRFPWLVGRRGLPNYFLYPPEEGGNRNYSKGVLVFLHVPRTGGGALQDCLQKIGRNRTKIYSTPMKESLRIAWDDETRLTPEYRNAFDGHVTLHALGLCDSIRRPCSYATLVRHPLERAISSYFHCRDSLGDPMCSVINANHVTLREWVVFQGSVFFRALLFNAAICRTDLNASVSEHQLLMPMDQVPCWFKHKIWFEQLEQEERNMLADFVVDHLDKWFAVFGITEDVPGSSALFESVYALPFTDCSQLCRSRKEERLGEKSRQRLQTNSVHLKPIHALSYDDYVELQYDYSVQKALDADYRLYGRVKHIVQLQKQIFSNKIKS